MRVKDSYFLELEHEGVKGMGECGILKGLSADDRPHYEEMLTSLCMELKSFEDLPKRIVELDEWPSIQAGLEMALLDYKADNHILFPSDFTDGYERQPINGLIWMGDLDYMVQQVEQKIQDGFLVLKMKIGALAVDQELSILQKIRSKYGPHELQLRVDANGAFDAEQALPILEKLDRLRVHSIEQPIKAGNIKDMARLCRNSPLPIALDEELIGVFKEDDKVALLEEICPRYIILKPSFLGGFEKSEDWIEMAEKRGIGWWVTSALESNYGLSAIAQWNYNLYGHLASGLGTGSLYTNNFESPLRMIRGTVGFDPKGKWDLSGLSF